MLLRRRLLLLLRQHTLGMKGVLVACQHHGHTAYKLRKPLNSGHTGTAAVAVAVVPLAFPVITIHSDRPLNQVSSAWMG